MIIKRKVFVVLIVASLTVVGIGLYQRFVNNALESKTSPSTSTALDVNEKLGVAPASIIV